MIFDQSHADEHAALLAVARTGSFRLAGLEVERHATIISKRIASLEKRLGVRLLERTTRRVRLTDVGERLVAALENASASIEEAEQQASAGARELRGRLRLALPAAMGRMWLAPKMPLFSLQYPGLDIEVDYAERFVDLVGEGFDAAVRIGSLPDSRLIARKLADHRIVLGASPEYLEKFGRPSHPGELVSHNLLRYTGPVSSIDWRFRQGKHTETVSPAGSFRSNDIGSLIEAARHGIGIAAFGEWSMAKDFSERTLVKVLPDWQFERDESIFVVRPSKEFAPARTEAFISWLARLFSRHPPWEPS